MPSLGDRAQGFPGGCCWESSPWSWHPSPQPRPPPQQQRAAGSLEEVVLAVHALPAAEAALSQWCVAVAALETLAVPVAVQGLEDEAVQDMLVTASAQWDLCKAGGGSGVRSAPRMGGSRVTFPSWP